MLRSILTLASLTATLAGEACTTDGAFNVPGHIYSHKKLRVDVNGTVHPGWPWQGVTVCSDACIRDANWTGICPQSLFITTLGLVNQSCQDRGYTDLIDSFSKTVACDPLFNVFFRVYKRKVTPSSSYERPACGGIIGSMTKDGKCVMQGKTDGGGLGNGVICSGRRDLESTLTTFDQPNRTFTCVDGSVLQNGVYDVQPPERAACKGIIGSMNKDGKCMMQGRADSGGLDNGIICDGERDIKLTLQMFDQPNRTFTCTDGSVVQNGVYVPVDPKTTPVLRPMPVARG
jgi:hypothetical protein